MLSRRLIRLLAVVALLIPAVVVGIWLGGHPSKLPGWVPTALVSEDVRTLDAALDIIEDDFYRPVNRDQLVNHGLGGAVRLLRDRYSRYLTPQDYRRFQEAAHGRFSGVGLAVLEIRSGLRVTRVFTPSPAARAGIRAGDAIVAVNGRSISGRPDEVSTSLIRGRPGTPVTLTVISQGRRREERLIRANVEVAPVESSLRRFRGRRLAVVSLSGFTEGSHGFVRQAIARQRARGARGVVLDLRGNGGGLLSEAILVASVFIPEGTIVATDGRSRKRRTYDATGSAISTRVPVVVLVNRNSASASEIVAAAIQDRERGVVVGTHTFGKGVFQEVTELPNGGALDLTVGQYFTPDGRNLGGAGTRRGAGVAPDVPARDDPETPADEALRTALATLASRVR